AGVGEIGEICVRTPYLTRGYITDDSLAHERFIANPFGDQRPTTNDQRPTLSTATGQRPKENADDPRSSFERPPTNDHRPAEDAAEPRSSFVVRRSSDR